MRVLHVLDHSLPVQSGYASRSHSILSAMHDRGVDVEALTGPKQGVSTGERQDIDGVAYRRAPVADGVDYGGVAGQIRTITATRAALKDRLAGTTRDVLHAHSPCLNGLAAFGLGVPLVYEMRSSWEDAAVSNGTTREGSPRYRVSRWLESRVVHRADAVAVICDGLKRELVDRGVPADKVFVLPNAVPDSFFEAVDEDAVNAVRQRYGLAGKRVIGFFGSFFAWEGIDELITAMGPVHARYPDARLLLAGGGRLESELTELAERLGVADAVIFAGRLPKADIPACYAASDLMVFPRQSIRLTEMVTPLKPLESMAAGVPVLASDIGGHRELIRDGETGFLYPGGGAALAGRMIELLGDDGLRNDVVAAARNWVHNERRWPEVVKRYDAVYEKALASRSNRESRQ